MQNDKLHLESWSRNLDRILPGVGMLFPSKLLNQSRTICVSVVKYLKLKQLGENIYLRRMAGGIQHLTTLVAAFVKYVELSSTHAVG